MAQDSDVLIVGGGIGGLAAALACARAGREVRLLERADRFAEVGAGLQLGPNGARALERLGVLEALDDLAVFPSQIVMRSIWSGDEVSRIDLGPRLVQRFGYRYRVMHRSDLLDALLAAVQGHSAVTLETGRQVVDAEFGESSSEVRCADGSRFRGRILVAADGLNSVLRPLIAGPDQTRCEGYSAYRGTVPFAELPEHAGEDTVVLYAGDGVHLVQYPVRGGRLYNQVACFRSKRFDGASAGDDWATPEELDAAFADAAPYVRASIARIDRRMRWPLKDRAPIDRWVRGTAVLMGDAAHPMYQYVAQGACQALEDAVALGDCLGGGSGSEALHRFATLRQKRTARVQETARRFGDIIHFGGTASALRDHFLASRDPADYAPMEWLWGPPDGHPARPGHAAPVPGTLEMMK